MFTKSICGLSRAAKRLFDEKLPSQLYYYFDYDSQYFGSILLGEALKAKTDSRNKFPFVWICSRYIGGTVFNIEDASFAHRLDMCTVFFFKFRLGRAGAIPKERLFVNASSRLQ